MSKVTVVGAGNVGATCANVLAVNEVANEIVLIDIKEGLSEGKAMDIMQTAQLMGFDSVVRGVTNDYSATADSDVVIITSGIPRKPGIAYRCQCRYSQECCRKYPQTFTEGYPYHRIEPDGHDGLSIVQSARTAT